MENTTTVHMSIEMQNGQITKQETVTGSSTPQERFLLLAKLKESVTEQYRKVSEDLEAAMKEVGLDQFVQDPETKVVYQITKPKGRYVMFSDIDYIRTRKSVDEKGELSMDKAMAAGFDLGDLGPKKKKG